MATSVSRATPVNTSAACLNRALLRHAVVEEALETPAPGAFVEPYTALTYENLFVLQLSKHEYIPTLYILYMLQVKPESKARVKHIYTHTHSRTSNSKAGVKQEYIYIYMYIYIYT